ncbi:YceI family protein [Glycomyces tenuis]|uniref:YceI family protein n=1 Tax=Glycomyces tenuis TaxID=58116 RepID=UPI0004064E06|nr:YceI family protein [Glycomyces tenuis]
MDQKPDRGTATPPAGHYEIDPAGSRIAFATTHLFGMLPVRGSFALDGGTVEVAEPLTDSTVRAEIAAASFDTGNKARDEQVRSRRYLDTDRYPSMTFVSERIEGDRLIGALTAHGVTRPVTLAVEAGEVSAASFTARASVRIDRTDFGVTAGRGMTGRHLDVTIDVTCTRRR